MLAVLNTETLETVEKIPPPAGSRSWGEAVVDTSTNFLYAADGGSVLVITHL